MALPDQIILRFKVVRIRSFAPTAPPPDDKHTFVYDIEGVDALGAPALDRIGSFTIKQATADQYPSGQVLDIRFDQFP